MSDTNRKDKAATAATVETVANVTNVNNVTNDSSFDLTAEDIFTGNPPEMLEIPERSKNGRPGVLFIAEIPARSTMKLFKSRNIDPASDDDSWLFEMMSLSIVNRNGNRLFDTPEKINLLADTIPPGVFKRIADKVMEKNGLSNVGGEIPLDETTSSDSSTPN